jgi:hypothetical protein
VPKCSYDRACDEWPQSVATVDPFFVLYSTLPSYPSVFLEQGWDDLVVLGSPRRPPTSPGWVRPQRFAMGGPGWVRQLCLGLLRWSSLPGVDLQQVQLPDQLSPW